MTNIKPLQIIFTIAKTIFKTLVLAGLVILPGLWGREPVQLPLPREPLPPARAALHRRPGREPTTLAYSSHRPSLPSRPRRVLITPDLVMSGMIEALH